MPVDTPSDDPVPVLLIDDDPVALRHLEGVLARPDLSITHAASGEQALGLLARRDFAAVVLDLEMPGADGFDTARLARAQPRAQNTPIIFATAHSAVFPVAEAYRLGAVDYLTKPLVPEIIRAKVAVFADLYRAARRVRELERRERVRAEDDLQAAERRLQTMVESATDYAIFSTDTEGRVTYWNAGAERLFGWPEADILGETVDVLYTPEDRAAGRPEHERREAAESGRAADERWHVRRDGTRFWASGVVTPIRDRHFRGFAKVARDLTARKVAEDAVRASEARQRFLADLAAATQPLADPAAITATAARLLGEHLGVDRCAYAAVEGESVFDITGDYCRGVPSIVGRWPVAAFGAEVVRLMAAGEPYVVEDVEADSRAGADLAAYRATDIRAVICVPLHKAGRFTAAMAVHQTTPRRWTATEVELVQFVAGRCWESIERSRADRDLKESEERLQLAISIAQMGTFAVDLRTDAVTVNEPGRAIYGWPSPHTTFAAVQTHFHPADKAAVMRAVESALDPAGPGAFEVEQRIVRTDGAERWIRVRGRAVFAGDGPARTAAKLLGTYLDVTDAKQMEVSLREADRRKDEFLATLAHELRNPLAPIRNALTILRLAGGNPDATGHAISVMDRQVAHMVRLIDDLLDVSRVSRGKIDLRRQKTDLADAVRAAVETSGPAVERGRHSLMVSLPDHPVWLDADPDRLAQAVANVLNNAAKYTPPGGRISVLAGVEDGRAVVRVRDTGVGIPADMLSKVWDLFAQVDQSLHRSQGGLGIGLALVRSLVEMHGGSVEARSKGAGQGSEFVLRLPLAPGQVRVERRGADATPPMIAPPPPRGLNVLLVEDNHDAAETLRMVLEMAGHAVALAFDGPSGVEAARRVRPDAVVCDIGLPGLDGYGVARALRADPRTATALLISASGYGQAEDRRKAREAGFDHSLVKPVAPDTLVRLLFDRARARSRN